MTLYTELEWTRNETGECNEMFTYHRFRTLIVYSNLEGTQWSFLIDDDPPRGNFKTKEQAMRGAVNHVEGR